jgi:hypothetical protein
MAQTKILASGFDVDVISGNTALAAQPASDDEIIISDGGTLKRLDLKHIQNTPAIMVQKSGNQTVGTGSATKVTWDVEDLDSDGTFASDRFTPAVAGKYFCYTQIAVDAIGQDKNLYCMLYFNGSHAQSGVGFSAASGATITANIGAIFDMDADDYVEVYAQHNHGSDRNIIGNSTTESVFLAYRIAGV